MINDTSRLLSTKGDPIITLIAKGNVSRTIGLEKGRKKRKKEKKGRESENVKMVLGKKSFVSVENMIAGFIREICALPAFMNIQRKRWVIRNSYGRMKRLRVKWADAEERWRGEEMLG